MSGPGGDTGLGPDDVTAIRADLLSTKTPSRKQMRALCDALEASWEAIADLTLRWGVMRERAERLDHENAGRIEEMAEMYKTLARVWALQHKPGPVVFGGVRMEPTFTWEEIRAALGDGEAGQ